MKNENKNTPKKPRGALRKLLRFFAFSFLGFFTLLVIISILLAFPPVQTYIAQKAATYFSEKMGITVTIDKIGISLISRKVHFKELTVLDHHQDTLLRAEKLSTGIALLNLSESNVELGETKLQNALFRLHKYEGEEGMNLDYILRQFKSDKPKEGPSKPFGFKIRHILLDNVAFNYIDDTAPILPASFQPGNIRTLVSSGEMDDFRVAKDSIIFKVRELRALDHSGSGMAHFETDFVICSTAMFFENTLLETVEGSFVKGDIRFRYATWRSFSNFIDSVRFDSDIKQSSVLLKDIAYYSDALKGIPVMAKFKGKVTGPVSAFKGRDLELNFGEYSGLRMDADVYGLPNIDSAFFDVKMKGLVVTANDIARLKLYEDGSGLVLPAEVYRMGKISYVGRLTGNTWDFVTKGVLNSDIGLVQTDLRLAGEPGFKNPIYSGTVKTKSFDPGKLTNNPFLGAISGELKVEGKGFDPKTMKATAKGSFSNFVLYGYTYSNVDVNGTFEKMAFDGNLTIDDENVELVFNGKTDFSGEIPLFNFNASLSNVNLQKLGFWNDTLIIHHVKLDLDLKAKSIDAIKGTLHADSLFFTADTNTHFVQHIDLTADSLGNERRFAVNSSIMDLAMTGSFTYVPLINNLLYNANAYFPSFKLNYDSTLARITQTFRFNVALKNMKPVFDIFYPDVYVAPNTTLSGRYFSDIRDAELELASDYIGFKKMRFTDPEFTLATASGDVEIDLSLSRFNVSDSLWFDYINVESAANNDSVSFGVRWIGDVYNISSGNINFRTWMGTPGNYDLYFYNTQLLLKEKKWTLGEKAFLSYSDKKLLAKDFDLTSEFGGSLKVSGVGSESKDDKLNITLDKFPVAYLRTFGENLPELGGQLSGTAGIGAVFENPIVTANLRVDTLSMYGQLLGDFLFTSAYNNYDQSLVLNGTLKTDGGNSLELKNGKIYPMRQKGENMDLDFTFQRFNVKPAEVFSAPVITNLKGFLTGKLHIGGTFKTPELVGSGFLDGGHVDIPYIGASFNLKFKPSKEFIITKDKIDFGEIILEDENYSTATLKGYIKHNKFKDLELYAEVKGRKFQFFNASKEQSPSFYGTAIATGTAEVKGPFETLDVYARMTTEKGTQLFIPMASGPSQASENNFVIFVDGRDTTTKEIQREKRSVSGIQLFVEAQINENAEVQIIFDEFTGEVIRSVGKGDLRIELNRLGDLTMYGDYEVIKGDYLFTLKNLISKNLKLRRGGVIYWSGDPTKARIDASAVYPLRTSTVTLFPESDDTENNFKTRIPVEVVVNLDGELLEPQITFDIEFPTVDETTRAKLQQAISSEDEKNKQAFALLVLGQFISSGTGTGDAANIASGNSLEVLSNQLSNWVSKLSEDVDVGVRYRSKDKTSSGQDEVELALSTKLFDDRVSIDGNLGLATTRNTNASNTSTGNNGNMLDLTVEVKITNDGKVRVRGFNRSNDANIIRPFPYTQGVGLSYQTSFDTWRELFMRKRRRMREELERNKTIQKPPNETDKAMPPKESAPPDSLPPKIDDGGDVKPDFPPN